MHWWGEHQVYFSVCCSVYWGSILACTRQYVVSLVMVISHRWVRFILKPAFFHKQVSKYIWMNENTSDTHTHTHTHTHSCNRILSRWCLSSEAEVCFPFTFCLWLETRSSNIASYTFCKGHIWMGVSWFLPSDDESVCVCGGGGGCMKSCYLSTQD